MGQSQDVNPGVSEPKDCVLKPYVILLLGNFVSHSENSNSAGIFQRGFLRCVRVGQTGKAFYDGNV